MSLYSQLKPKVIEWRKSQYPSDFPIISEILNYNYDPEIENLRFLRKSQFEALAFNILEKNFKKEEQEGMLYYASTNRSLLS